jgi:hypothetical protein
MKVNDGSLLQFKVKDFITKLQNFGNNNLDRIFDEKNTINDKAMSMEDFFGGSGSGENAINLYPCDNKGACCEEAWFISFHTSPFKTKFKKTHLVKMEDMLPIMIQKVLGTCRNHNRNVILITDRYNQELFKPWMGNLKFIKERSNSFDILLMFPNGETESIINKIGL